MPVRYVSTRDQQTITVNAMVASPLYVPERIISVLDKQFIMDQALRNAGNATGGAVQFRVSSGLFTDRSSEIVPEFGEIPLTTVTRGDIQSKPTAKRGLGVGISEEMMLRNDTGEVNRQITALKNTMLRDIDGAFLKALRDAVVTTRAATAPWAAGTATIRKDINASRLLVVQAQAPGTVGGNNFLAFNPDTLVISQTTEADLLNSTEFLQLIYGSANPQNTGAHIDRAVLGLNVLVTPSLNGLNEAWVMESKTVGGFADEIPLRATPLYDDRRATMSYRSDTVRSTVAFIDQPLAAAKIAGV